MHGPVVPAPVGVKARKRANTRALAEEVAAGAVTLGALPSRLQVEVTNRCTLPCLSCAHRVWDASLNRPQDLPPSHFLALAPLLEVAEEVLLGGYGDPTLGPWLLPLVRAARGFGCRVVMITGGAALSGELIHALGRAGLDRLILSMDGARDGTLRALRGLPLHAYLGWMDDLARSRDRGDGFRPELQVNFVAQRDNVEELPDLVDLAAERGALGVHAFHLKVYDPSLSAHSLFRHRELAERCFAEARRRALLRGVFLRLPSLDGGGGDCRQPFETLFLLHDGEVRSCCAAVFRNARYGLKAGHLDPAGSAADLWNAPQPVAFRRAATTGGAEPYPTPCQACPFRVASLEAHLRPLGG